MFSFDRTANGRRRARARARLLLVLVFSALASACVPYELKAILDGPKGSALSITPSVIIVPGTQTVSFAGSGGVEPYTYTLVSGLGSIDSVTGVYTAPAPAGTAVVSVTDKTGRSVNATITILTVSTALAISPSAISLGVGSSVTFAAIGGTPPYAFSIQSAGSGVPAVNAGTGYYVTGAATGLDVVKVTDNVGATSTANVTVTAAAAVDYTVTATSLPAAATAGAAVPGGQTFTLRNNGVGAGALAVDWKLYLSQNTTLDGGDTLVGSGSTAALGAGASAPVTVGGTFPSVASGAYYLIVQVASGEDISPLNNTSAASAITINPRNIDYIVPAVPGVNHVAGVTAGGAMSGNFSIQNSGTAAGSSTIYWTAYASADAVLDAGDYLLARGSRAALGAGASSGAIAFNGFWPSTPGNWYLIVTAAAFDDVNHGNDTRASAAPIAVTGLAPANVDYIVTTVLNTGTSVAGKPLTGTFTYRNTGSDSGAQTVYWTAYLSTDAVLNVGTDTVIDSGTAAFLAATTTSGAIPFSGTWSTAGTWYLLVAVSSSDDLVPANNTGASAGAAVTAPDINYNVNAVNNTGGSVAGDPLAGSFTFRNAGTAAGSQAVVWTAYLSANTTLELGTDIVVDSGSTAALGAGAVSGLHTFTGTWPSTPGPWYLLVALAAAEDVNPGNNTLASGLVTTTAPSVDYAVPSVVNTGGTTAGSPLAGTLTLHNAGAHAGTQQVTWRAYLSANATLEIGTDTLIDSGFIASPGLGAGASSAALPFAGTWPASLVLTNYYIVVEVASGDDGVAGNNVGASVLIPVSPRSIDYVVPAVSNTGPTIAGGAVAATFTVRNSGGAGGSSTVYWSAYASADATLDAGDYLLARGTTAALGAGATSAGIPFNGFWPSTPGNWYIIVKAAAFDDINHGNDATATALPVLVTGTPPANVDYIVTAVTSTGGQVAGKPIAATFTYRNTGSDSGTQAVYWTAYLSTDAVLNIGTDTVIDSGTVPFLAAATTSGAIPFVGTWSGTGTWYLIVALSSPQDLVPGNNVTPSGGVAITAPDVNYNVNSVNNTGGSVAGDPLSGSFTFRNAGTAAGSQAVVWTAYLSLNTTLEIGTDIVMDSGSTAALGAGAVSGLHTFAGTWPSAPGPWYLIVALSVAEDVNPGNNTLASGLVTTTAPSIDYRATAVTNTGGTTAGSPLSGTIDVRNLGTHDGRQPVPWRVYLSSNATLQIGTDVLIASGSIAAPGLFAGGTLAAIPFSGTWPVSVVAANYYFVVEVDASDDVVAGNNVNASAVVPVNPPSVEYVVVSPVNNTGGLVTGGPIAGTFQVHNNGTANGGSPITWTAHYSTNNTLEVTDPVIDTGTIGAVAGGGTSGATPFAGTWPVTAGNWYLIVEIAAADDTNTANNSTPSGVLVLVAPTVDYNVTAVPLPAGATTGQAVSGTITIQNTGSAAGSSVVTWQVYASLGNTTWDAGDVLLDAGSFAALGSGATSSPAYAGTWPATAGTYYIIARASAADDPTVGQAASAARAVSNPPQPDYTVSFNAAMPWSGLVNTAMNLTGTTQITVQNLNANPGFANVTWSVYMSADTLLDAGDALVQQATIGPLGGSASSVVTYGGNWPASPGRIVYLIATVQAADDANGLNNAVLAPHPVAVGDYRYVEGAENNNGSGTNPPAAQTSNTLVTTLGANQAIAIEATMDVFGNYDTFKFTTVASMSRLSMRALWDTGFDDLDLYLWDTGATNLSSLTTAADSEPGGATFNVISVTPRICYISASAWLANNTSGSVGQKYVILVLGQP
jgi:hypothetical protein